MILGSIWFSSNSTSMSIEEDCNFISGFCIGTWTTISGSFLLFLDFFGLEAGGLFDFYTFSGSFLADGCIFVFIDLSWSTTSFIVSSMIKHFDSTCYIWTEVPDRILLSTSTLVDTSLNTELASILWTDSLSWGVKFMSIAVVFPFSSFCFSGEG